MINSERCKAFAFLTFKQRLFNAEVNIVKQLFTVEVSCVWQIFPIFKRLCFQWFALAG